MTTNLRRLNIHVTPKQFAALRAESKRLGESVAFVIRRAITRTYLDKPARSHREPTP